MLSTTILFTMESSFAQTTDPIITLTGSNPQYVERGSLYTEFGATTNDSSSITIGGDTVNINIPGNYTVTYTVTNSSHVQENRIVVVQDTISPTVVGTPVYDTQIHTLTIKFSENVTINIANLNIGGLHAPTSINYSNNPTLPIFFNSGTTSFLTGGSEGNADTVFINFNTVSDISNNTLRASNYMLVLHNGLDITLHGSNPQYVEFGSNYTELGAAVSFYADLTINDSSVDITTLGNYTVIYTAINSTNSSHVVQVNRTVVVQDTTAPIITLIGNSTQYVEFASNYTDLNATTDDGTSVIIGGDPVNITQIGNYTVTYDATDTAGNIATQVNRIVIVQDTNAPIITLTGSNPQYVERGSLYTEFGATTNDSSSITIGGDTVNVNIPGNYTVTYTVTNSSHVQENRIVVVQDTISPTVVGTPVYDTQIHTLTIKFSENVTINIANLNIGGLHAPTSINYSNNPTLPIFFNSGTTSFLTGGSEGNADTVFINFNTVSDISNNTLRASNYMLVLHNGLDITLHGSNPQYVEFGSNYTELGAAVSFYADLTINDSSVDITTLGNYTVIYTAINSTNSSHVVQVNRTVVVQDTTAPIITLIGNSTQYVEFASNYTDLNATTDDGTSVIIGGDPVNITQIGNYTVTYDATDTAGNIATQVNRIVIVQDTNAPIITLTGSNPQYVERGSLYTEFGATTNDSSGITIGGDTVNINIPGNYTVTYTVTNSSHVQENRIVVVQDTISPTVVGTPVYDTQIHTLTIKFSENVTINIANLNIGGLHAPTSINYSNNPTLPIFFNSGTTSFLTGGSEGNADTVFINFNTVSDISNNTLRASNYMLVLHNGLDITLHGSNPQYVEFGSNYTELGAAVSFYADLTINDSSVDITTLGNYTVIYTAINSTNSSHVVQVNRTVVVQDTTAPIITLIGNSTQYVEFASNYTDLNATTDDGTSVIIGGDPVNITQIGNYTVTYDATDTAGNIATQVNRIVIVQDTNAPIITLTGSNPQYVERGSLYTEFGATTNDSSSITIGGDTVNINIPGNYTVTYTVTNSSHVQENRIVVVQDTISPTVVGTPVYDTQIHTLTIKFSENVTINIANLNIGGLHAPTSINYSNNPTLPIFFNSGTTSFLTGGSEGNADTVFINFNTVSDISNNTLRASNYMLVLHNGLDITLHGSNPQYVEFGSNYTELGAAVSFYADLTINDSSVDITTLGNYTVIYTAINSTNSSHVVQVNRTVVVQDTTAPIITLIGNSTQYVEFASNYTDLNATTDDGTSVIIGGDPVNITQIGNYTVTYDATDTAGNIATQVNRIVIVQDTNAPIITLTGSNPQYVERGSPYTELGATTNDSSGITIGGDTVNINIPGNYTVTYTVTNSSHVQENRIVVVQDTNAPIITLIGNSTQYVEFASNYTDLNATTDDGTSVIIGGDPVNITQIGNYTVTYDATDTAGNIATQVNRIVIVQDTNAPIITLIGNSTQYIEFASNYTDLNATTDDGTSVIIGGDPVNITQIGNYTVTYDATDTAGNIATQVNRIVIVQDTTAPIITLIGNSTQYVEFASNYTDLNATTDDGTSVIIGGDPVNITQIGNYTVTYDATDTAGNIATQVNRIVIVQDTTAPIITLIGNSTQYIEFASNYTDLNATTDDGTSVIIGGDPVNITQIGNYTVTYDATDTAGNIATQVNRIVIVQDTTAPIITLIGNSTQYVEFASNYTDLNATTDDGTSVIIGGDPVNITQIGNYTVTYDATDTAGNIATQVNRIVIVQDTTAPIITLTGSNPQYVERGSLYTEFGATTNDSSSITIGGDTVNINIPGNYTVTYTVTNSSHVQENRIVVVQDTISPTVVGTPVYDTQIHTLTIKFSENVTINIANLNIGGLHAPTSINYSNNPTLPIFFNSGTTSFLTGGSEGNADTVFINFNTVSDISNNTLRASNYMLVLHNGLDITLHGSNPQYVEFGSNYTELGAAVSFYADLTINDSSVDITTLGNYTVIYTAINSTNSSHVVQVNRTVVVQDTTAPIITLTGSNPQIIELNSSYIELGATVDGNSTLIINNSSVNTTQIGNYTVTYDATDTAGNIATQVNRTVIVRDTTPPTIVGIPIYETQTHTLTITFNENVNISNPAGFGILAGNSTTTSIDYLNNPTLVLTFTSQVTTLLLSPNTLPSDVSVFANSNSVQDNSNNGITAVASSPLTLQHIILEDNFVIDPSTLHIDSEIILNSSYHNVTINYTATTNSTINLDRGLTTKFVSTNNITLNIPTDTVITHDGTWNSEFVLPHFDTFIAPNPQNPATINTPIIVITFGSLNTSLNLNKIADIVFEGYGGMNYSAYYQSSAPGSIPQFISNCGISNVTEITNLLTNTSTNECVVDDGMNVIFYTNHFTTFALISSSIIATSLPNTGITPVSVGGGGGGGNSGGVGNILSSGHNPLMAESTLYSISWKVSDGKKLIEIVAGPLSDNAFVTISSANVGIVTTEPSSSQPYTDRVIYLGQVGSDEKFVYIKAGVYANTFFTSEQKLVNISEPTGSVTFDSMSALVQTPDGTMMFNDTINDTLMTNAMNNTMMTDDTINDTLMTNAMNNTMNNTMMNNEKMASLPDSDGGCLVATAAYGTELSQQVQLLREVRDVTLMNTVHGASFMTSFSQIYYTFSPVIADIERENSLLRGMLQTLLYPLLSSISIMTLSDGSEVQTLGLGLAVILFNILLYISAPIFAIYYIKRIILLKYNI